MATLQTYSKGAGVDLRKLAPLGSANAANQLRSDLAPVVDDFTAGCGAGATLAGPARPFVGSTQRVMVSGWASAPGTLFMETSTDGGSTWNASDSEFIPAGEHVIGSAVTQAGANRYRLRFVCGPVGATRVAFSSQARA